MTKLAWTKTKDASRAHADYTTPLPRTIEVGWDQTATQVLRWYNAYERSWVVSFADADGHQVGSSEYVYSAADADAEAQSLIESVANPSCRICGKVESADECGSFRPRF